MKVEKIKDLLSHKSDEYLLNKYDYDSWIELRADTLKAFEVCDDDFKGIFYERNI